jgi:predicted HAD superfamily phosphohydrolase YqeG
MDKKKKDKITKKISNVTSEQIQEQYIKTFILDKVNNKTQISRQTEVVE